MQEEIENLMKTHKIERNGDILKINLNSISKQINLEISTKKILNDSSLNLNIPSYQNYNNLAEFINEIEIRNIKKFYKINEMELPPILNNSENNVEYAAEKRNIAVLICKNPLFEIQCLCNKKDFIKKSKKCLKCQKNLNYKFFPIFSNSNDTNLGKLEFENYKILGFLKSNFQFSCQNCGEFYETALDIDRPFREKCFKCLNIIFIKLIFLRLKSDKDMHKLVLGTSLPEKGVCKHYKKSFRWFKFQCCNRMFPCDICHDESSNHICERASKMICGFCSKEQNCQNECNCGMSLKNNSKFWNGGKGMRDKSKLNKKDSKKYKK